MQAIDELDELDEHDDENTPSRQEAAKRSTLVSVFVNIGLTIGQVTTGILAGSAGLIADGIHSLSDLVADFVVLFANHHSQKAPDEDHHYGHQRYENAASLTLGLLLLAVGVGMLWGAFHKIEQPGAIQQVKSIAIWVALAALLAKELLFRYMLNVAQKVRSSMLIANAWHARSDAAASLVVAVGIAGSLLGYPMLDPLAAMIVGFMVTKMGWSFAWDALQDLMDRAVDDETVQAIRVTLTETPGVLGWHDLKTRKAGDMILVDVHLEIDADITVEQGHDIALDARRRVMERHAVLDLMTHVDPLRIKPSPPQGVV
ncbi:cation diffusion facilitator family transporter [Actimicrobium sp. CCI2.3]|uniref:cation diffusion facilitator family transporter n=1 Tax=Actimicrobium sp. CCI2.3 TaxID=3048616 RepID=UPI002AB50BE4|nr:cation diffusion facilitator family transporter [Actimicrobium sp. CCI2.3]MDY7575198.1 cation diffusion facilitator family transporter [Actimicrobium sp. CCI2.3]MEB0022339.1 cation diffusion facilitator family transporter [Actimicrobium sp. CCI2.3]